MEWGIFHQHGSDVGGARGGGVGEGGGGGLKLLEFACIRRRGSMAPPDARFPSMPFDAELAGLRRVVSRAGRNPIFSAFVIRDIVCNILQSLYIRRW